MREKANEKDALRMGHLKVHHMQNMLEEGGAVVKIPDGLTQRIKSIRWNSPNVSREETEQAKIEAVVQHCARICQKHGAALGSYKILAEFGLDDPKQ